MNRHDYVVTVDEHGEAIISHALFGLGKGGQKKDHKYYTRVQDKNRWRYFYSPEEFRAWQTGGSKKKVSTSDKMKSAFKQLKESNVVNDVATKVRDKVAPQHKERLDAAKKNLDEARTNFDSNERRVPQLKKDWFDAKDKFDSYDTSLFKKYGRDYKSKMSTTEKNKYDEYRSDLSEKAEAGWDAAVVQSHSGTDKNRPTLKDKLVTAQREYDDEADYTFKEFGKDVASNVKDKLKSKSDRMKEEFRKKAKETAETVKDKAKSKIDEVKDTYQHNKEAIAKAEELDKKAEHSKVTITPGDKLKKPDSPSGPATHQKPEATGSAKEGSLTRYTAEKSKYSEYTKGDSDFDDDNYQEENRVGDTDFFIHKRKDGTNVILEEDMKWVLPKGVDGKSPEIQKAIKDFASHAESARKLGENYTGDQWTNEVTKAIDDAVRKTPISSSKSDSSKKEEPYVSDEYKQAVEFNSKKNNYFGRSGDSYEQSTFSPKTTTKMTVDPRKVSSEYMLTAAYNSGIDISKLQSADNKHAKAQRAYNQALNNPNTSSQEKDRLFRELTKAEKAYYDEADKIADELNKK